VTTTHAQHMMGNSCEAVHKLVARELQTMKKRKPLEKRKPLDKRKAKEVPTQTSGPLEQPPYGVYPIAHYVFFTGYPPYIRAKPMIGKSNILPGVLITPTLHNPIQFQWIKAEILSYYKTVLGGKSSN